MDGGYPDDKEINKYIYASDDIFEVNERSKIFRTYGGDDKIILGNSRKNNHNPQAGEGICPGSGENTIIFKNKTSPANIVVEGCDTVILEKPLKGRYYGNLNVPGCTVVVVDGKKIFGNMPMTTFSTDRKT